MKNKFTKIAAGLLAAAIMTIEFLSPIANASKIEIEAGQEDIFNELEEAAKVNVAMNTLWKCLRSDYYTPSTNRAAISGKDVAKGKIFVFPGLAYEVDIGTSLWMENLVQANGGDDGAIYCQQDKGDNLLNIVTKKILDVEYADILCYPDGRGRIYYRSDLSTDTDCQHFDDKGAMYKRFDDWETGLRDFYNNWRATAGNKYLPTYDEIGNYNNVDGYFNYLLDFNKYCGYDGTPSRTKGANESAYPITTFEKSTTKIVFKTRYYHLSSDKSWQHPLSTDNPVTTCSGLLQRIEILKDTWNEAVRVDKREYGYSSIILANLEDACKNLKTADGENAYDALRRELEAIRDNTSGNATEEDIAKAKENLATLNSITDYVVSSGDEFDVDGKIYKCVDIEGLKITLNEYHPPSEDTGEEDPFAGKEDEASCFDHTGVVGWIVCPIIEFLGDFIQSVYGAFIVPFLQLDTALFSTEANPVYDVWSDVRNVANLGFIIFFIVVIFSQLTGVGIDNYGIKKILPKLIIGAILINLSFIICQLAIDVSNILGYSIGNILDSFKVSESQIDVIANDGKSTLGKIGDGLGAGFLTVGVVAFMVAAVKVAGPEVWVAVLLALITIAIAILFCFILLIVRKSLAVMLVIVSPLAFMCYILPNTKKIFDKWFMTLKGLLLAFPICSALIYGGQFVGRLLVQASIMKGVSFTVALSGAVISVIPIFLVPGVIRKSMGAIGAAIGRVQCGLTRAARFHAGNSGWAMEKKMQGIQYRNARRAGFQASFRDGSLKTDENGNPIARGGIYARDENGNLKGGFFRRAGRALTGTNTHSIAVARGRMLNDMNMQARDQRLASESGFADAMLEQEVENYMGGASVEGAPAFADLTNNNDAATMEYALAGLMTNSAANGTRAAIVQRKALARAMATGSGDMKKGLSRVLSGKYQEMGADGKMVTRSLSESATGEEKGSIRGNFDNAMFTELAKDSTVRSGVADKNQYVARAMESANRGEVSSYEQWAEQAGNKEDVTANVLDKNNLFSQSGAVIQDAIKQTRTVTHEDGTTSEEFIVSSSRIEAALNNDNIDLDDATRKAMADQLDSRGYETKAAKAERVAEETQKAKVAEAGEVTKRHEQMMAAFENMSNQMGQLNVRQSGPEPITNNPGRSSQKWETFVPKGSNGTGGTKIKAVKMNNGSYMDTNGNYVNMDRWERAKQTKPAPSTGGDHGSKPSGGNDTHGGGANNRDSSSNGGNSGSSSNHTPSTGGDQNNA